MAPGLISFSSLLLCFSLVAAVPKQEIFDAINRISNEIRNDETLSLQNALREASAEATTPLQKSCIHRQGAFARGQLNAAFRRELVVLRKEYGSLSPAQVDQLSSEAVANEVRARLSAPVASAISNNNQIRGCV